MKKDPAKVLEELKEKMKTVPNLGYDGRAYVISHVEAASYWLQVIEDLENFEPLETECEWSDPSARFYISIVSPNGNNGAITIFILGNVVVKENISPAQLRDAAKILEYIEQHGELPETKIKEG